MTKITTGRSLFDSRQRLEMFLSSEASRPALVFTQPPVVWVSGSFPGLGEGKVSGA
jgi:hypothetical protein